jgi:NAD(P)H-nitrite reductase large subunit
VEPDDLVCYCFRVSWRKLANFARRERPRRVSQMSQCLGAGTGCGWCIPFVARIWSDPQEARREVDAETYARRRRAYHEEIEAGRDERTDWH